MFYHVKDLQFNARVTRPDPKFAKFCCSSLAARMAS